MSHSSHASIDAERAVRGAGDRVASRTFAWLALGAAAIGFGLVGSAYFMADDARREAEEPRPAAASASNQQRLRQTLAAFLSARTAGEKSRHVLCAEALNARIATYYAGRDPEELDIASFREMTPAEFPVDAAQAVFLKATRPGGRPVVAAFAPDRHGWKLDWELFTQTYDESFRRMLARPSLAVGTFKVKLQRHHADGANRALCLAVVDPFDAGQRVIVELPEGSIIRGRVLEGLRDREEAAATVELRWSQPGADGTWKAELQRVLCWGWRGLAEEADTRVAAVERREESGIPGIVAPGTPLARAGSPDAPDAPASVAAPASAPTAGSTAAVADPLSQPANQP